MLHKRQLKMLHYPLGDILNTLLQNTAAPFGISSASHYMTICKIAIKTRIKRYINKGLGLSRLDIYF